jgi:energy-coupling factor transport system ATP-binding protein
VTVTSPAPILETERLSYWYPSEDPLKDSTESSDGPANATLDVERAALRQVSLRFDRGEFVLVIGPSGSGKSTLIQALLGVVPELTGGAIGGVVRLEGEPVLANGLSGVAGRVGLVLQDPESQLTNLDVEGEVIFGPENMALDRDEIARRADESLRIAGIEHLRGRFVYALSGGQKQRVAIAAGLSMRPRVLLLDSPTSNLDPIGSAETLKAIVDLWTQGSVDLIVMAAHKIDDVLPHATRLIVIDQGRIVRDGSPANVLGGDLAWLRDDLGVFVPELCEVGQLLAGEKASIVTSAEKLVGSLRTDSLPPAPLASTTSSAGRATDSVNAVDVRDLHFHYKGGPPVLTGVSLSVPKGQFLALLGQNGTGKTTLAKNIAGLYRPSNGSIHVGGVEVTATSTHLASGHVGYVFQYPDHQFVAMTVEDELAYGPRAREMPEPVVADLVARTLEQFQLGTRAKAAPYTLSMGEKRRLSVATMLILQPSVLILDEPTTGQDRRNTIALMDILRAEARERGMTIIQITHDMEQAAEYADRVVVMDGGRIVFDGTAAGLFLEDELLLRCHLKPTPTAEVARALWPAARHIPVTPSLLQQAMRGLEAICR